jgi:CHASE3 domain sensor protein
MISMANKQKKKRNKTYTGVDAALTRPVVTKISAVNRNRVGQWWFEHKRIARPIIIATIVVTVIIILIVQLVKVATNA